MERFEFSRNDFLNRPLGMGIFGEKGEKNKVFCNVFSCITIACNGNPTNHNQTR